MRLVYNLLLLLALPIGPYGILLLLLLDLNRGGLVVVIVVAAADQGQTGGADTGPGTGAQQRAS